MNVHQFLLSARALIDHQLEEFLNQADDLPYSSLFSSARYSLLSPGKRLRPLIVLAICESYGIDLNRGLVPACALEMVHTYSMIHDDLPCMDDDDLRRGKPTLHKVYPEWHALLTGDFLLTHSFELLSSAPELDADQKVALINVLAKQAGAHGMIGGQMIDLLSEGKKIEWDLIERMHLGKTAGLITAALEFGGILASASSLDMDALRKAGSAIGLAFQLIDDLLDEVGIQEEVGKTIGSDINNNKATAVSLIGAEQVQVKATQCLQMAKEQIHSLSCPTPLLIDLFEQMIDRKK